MKRYLLFAFAMYYPSGGWSDFKESFSTVKEALRAAIRYGEDCYQIVDSVTGAVVEEAYR